MTTSHGISTSEAEALPFEPLSPLIDYHSVSQTIHILGPGNVGKFLAHSLAGIPKPPNITMLIHRHSMLALWNKMGRTINLLRDGAADIRSGYQAELAILPSEIMDPVEHHRYGPIRNLIVSAKAHSTVKALSTVASRLTRESTILFLQNGMGVLDEVNDQLFPDIETRPNYMIGVNTHGLNTQKPFVVTHAGIGTIAMGVSPRYPGSHTGIPSIAPSSLYLLRTLTRTPILGAVGFAPAELMQYQLEKLAINAIINPLTVMFDCTNGELLNNIHVTRVVRLLLAEISLVIRSLPELQNVPNLQQRFSTERLEAQVFGLAKNTADNRSSMLQDIDLGKQTEVEYINGYIVRRGEELGIKCLMNYTLAKMVRGRHMINSFKLYGILPVAE
ncbi:hypothetical protein MMC14_003950 [Varicellaria rhodocarpa]|nr:hypothetical protein [Varicellaria rhodocarpa]